MLDAGHRGSSTGGVAIPDGSSGYRVQGSATTRFGGAEGVGPPPAQRMRLYEPMTDAELRGMQAELHGPSYLDAIFGSD